MFWLFLGLFGLGGLAQEKVLQMERDAASRFAASWGPTAKVRVRTVWPGTAVLKGDFEKVLVDLRDGRADRIDLVIDPSLKEKGRIKTLSLRARNTFLAGARFDEVQIQFHEVRYGREAFNRRHELVFAEPPTGSFSIWASGNIGEAKLAIKGSTITVQQGDLTLVGRPVVKGNGLSLADVEAKRGNQAIDPQLPLRFFENLANPGRASRTLSFVAEAVRIQGQRLRIDGRVGAANP